MNQAHMHYHTVHTISSSLKGPGTYGTLICPDSICYAEVIRVRVPVGLTVPRFSKPLPMDDFLVDAAAWNPET